MIALLKKKTVVDEAPELISPGNETVVDEAAENITSLVNAAVVDQAR
jgi:hypothetical protein